MANTNVDLTEEDAADLQFPKDDDDFSTTANSSFSSDNVVFNSEITDFYCANCFSELVSRYILCDVCDINICCICFSQGEEFLNHKSDHDYRILNNNFILFENSDWTAEEELKLLDAIMKYGNWKLVATELPNRSVSDIIEHYNYFYLERNGSKLLPKIKETAASVFTEPVIPYRIPIRDSEEPPRYNVNTLGYNFLAGYNASRSDFECDYDTNAEDLLSNMEILERNDPHYKLITSLQCGIVKAYNCRLKERQRWKYVMREHGLLLLRKTVSWLHRFDTTITRPVYERLIRFMQFCEPMKFDFLMEGLHRSGELKIQISRLFKLRRKGITTLEEGRLYLRLNEIHEEKRKSLKSFRSNPKLNWKNNRNVDIPMITKYNKRRSGFSPIDIVEMPGYEKLTNKERDLCSSIRLVPVSFLELKDILVAENNKLGYLKLQTARKLLKIDVNKTRRLYDFLVQEGYVRKP